MNRDVGHAFRQTLPCADVERHVGPAPVVDENLHRRECLDFGFGIDVGFLAIRDCLLAEDGAVAVLTADGVLLLAPLWKLAQRAEHLDLFIACPRHSISHNPNLQGGSKQQDRPMLCEVR